MKISIGKVDRATRKVLVTFSEGELSHTREVNAVFADDGKHDREATRKRVDEVAQGVAHKFSLGLLRTVAESPDGEG